MEALNQKLKSKENKQSKRLLLALKKNKFIFQGKQHPIDLN